MTALAWYAQEPAWKDNSATDDGSEDTREEAKPRVKFKDTSVSELRKQPV